MTFVFSPGVFFDVMHIYFLVECLPIACPCTRMFMYLLYGVFLLLYVVWPLHPFPATPGKQTSSARHVSRTSVNIPLHHEVMIVSTRQMYSGWGILWFCYKGYSLPVSHVDRHMWGGELGMKMVVIIQIHWDLPYVALCKTYFQN